MRRATDIGWEHRVEIDMIHGILGGHTEPFSMIDAADGNAARDLRRETTNAFQGEEEERRANVEGGHPRSGVRQEKAIMAHAQGCVDHSVPPLQIHDAGQRVVSITEAEVRRPRMPLQRTLSWDVQSIAVGVENQANPVFGNGSSRMRLCAEPSRHLCQPRA